MKGCSDEKDFEKGTDFSSKILDTFWSQMKTKATQSVPLIFCKHSVALLWYVGHLIPMHYVYNVLQKLKSSLGLCNMFEVHTRSILL